MKFRYKSSLADMTFTPAGHATRKAAPGTGKEATLIADEFEVDFEKLHSAWSFRISFRQLYPLGERTQKPSADSRSLDAFWGMLPHFQLASERVL
jgi:hypothetical protein